MEYELVENVRHDDFLYNEEALVNTLREKKLIITTVESCTGGMIASDIVNISGASNVFKQGFITYCDEAKQNLVGVSADTLKKYFAVSAQTAAEMAAGGAKTAAADVCVAVTGVAGPSEEDGKPVGLVYIGVSVNGKVYVLENHFLGNRLEIRQQSSKIAIDMATRLVMKI